MSTPAASSPNTFFDSSTLEGRRAGLRKVLILFLVGAFAAPFLSAFFAPPPALLEEACAAAIKSIPEWQLYTGGAGGVALMAVCLFGVYRLWNFKWDGVWYLACSVLFPFFFVLPIPLVYSAFGYYVDSLASMIAGMLLFACWTNRDAFEPAPESTHALASDSTPSPDPSAS